MGLPLRILKHTASPAALRSGARSGAWVGGAPVGTGDPAREAGFPAVLFLPDEAATSDTEVSWRPRQVRQPTLLYDPARVPAGVEQPTKDSTLFVSAPELEPWTGGVEVEWQIDGAPQPFGPPGRVIGVLVRLKAVSD